MIFNFSEDLENVYITDWIIAPSSTEIENIECNLHKR